MAKSVEPPFCDDPPKVGEGPKTDVLITGDGSGCWEAIGDEPKIDVPVDFPSLNTTVDLKISSNSLRALYLSCCTDFWPCSRPLLTLPVLVLSTLLLTGVNTELADAGVAGALGVLDTFLVADQGSVNVVGLSLVFNKNKLVKKASPNLTVSLGGILKAGSKNGFFWGSVSSEASSASFISLDKSGMDGLLNLGANLGSGVNSKSKLTRKLDFLVMSF